MHVHCHVAGGHVTKRAHLNSLSDRQDRLQNYLESESKLP